MQRIVALTLLALLGAVPAAAGPATVGMATATGADAQAMGELLAEAIRGAAPQAKSLGGPGELSLERSPITEEIAHYSFLLPVGSGEHDVIRLHRIVRESAPWVPARAQRAAFLAHGDGWGFAATYLTSLATPAVPDTQSLPVFLAAGGVDVWGLDFRWSLVPPETTDLSFMADWGYGASLQDLDVALAVARAVHFATGSGLAKVHLVGFSRGGHMGWAQLSAETQRPPALRHIETFIAAEHSFKTDDEAVRQGNCASYEAILALLEAGTYANDYRIVAELGDLAAAAPEETSPYFPLLSNADFAEWLGADPVGGTIPHFHSVGGVVDPATFETELTYTRPELWFAFLSGSAAYQPLRLNLDGAAVVCDELDSPYDAHLGAIEVPIFYLGVAGAFGELGLHTLTLVGSSDVESLIVREAELPERDYGHNDLLLADGAQALVWAPILDWIESH